MRKLARAAVATVLLSQIDAVTAPAQCRYSAITFRGPDIPGFGAPSTTATGINNHDEVVGYYFALDGPETGYFWSEATGLVPLPYVSGGVRPTAINNAGQIVGSMGSSPGRAFLWDGGQYIDLGIPAGGTFSQALAINNNGVVVGYWGNGISGNPAWEGFVWENGVMTRLGPILGQPESRANDINDIGQISGAFGASLFVDFQGFVLEPDNSQHSLAQFFDCAYTQYSYINNKGDICCAGVSGHPSQGNFRKCAFAFVDGVVFNIPALPGYRDVFPRAIDESGTIIGECTNLGSQPFIWRDGITQDLESLIESPQHITQLVPHQFNQSGKIVGSCNRGGILLTPIPKPGDLNGDCSVDVEDVLLLLSNWSCAGQCAGDLDHNGVTEISDLAILLANWGA